LPPFAGASALGRALVPWTTGWIAGSLGLAVLGPLLVGLALAIVHEWLV
jgi:hypothetical protein